jgi:hypothetical protein
MQARAVGHPFGTYTQPLCLRDVEPSYEQVVIACEDGKRFLPLVQQVLPEARVLELETGHWPMLSQPADLAALLHHIR